MAKKYQQKNGDDNDDDDDDAYLVSVCTFSTQPVYGSLHICTFSMNRANSE